MIFWLALISLFGACLIIAAYYQQYCPNWFNLTESTQSWLNGALLNLGSGLIGSVIVISMYDKVQERIRENERKKRQFSALMEIGPILKSHNAFIMSIYAATSERPPQLEHQSAIEALLNKECIANAKFLDMYKPSLDSSLKNIPWYTSLHNHCLGLSSGLRAVQARYYNDLDTRIIELITSITNDNFVMLSFALPETVKFNNTYLKSIGLPVSHTVLDEQSLQKHIELITALIKYYNSLVSDNEKVSCYGSYWNLVGFPLGSGRVDNNIFTPLTFT